MTGVQTLLFRSGTKSFAKSTKIEGNPDYIPPEYIDIPDLLQQFKDTKHGSPSCLEKKCVDEHENFCNDECHAEWDKILDKIIFLFREMNEDTCRKKTPYQPTSFC